MLQTDRLRAARLFLVAAAETLAADEAHEFVRETGEWRDDASNGAIECRMFYHYMFGSLDSARDHAQELLARTSTQELPRQAQEISNFAKIFLAAGDTHQAIQCAKRSVHLSDQLEVYADPVFPYATLTDCYITTGNLREALTWRDRTEEVVERAGEDSFHLSNCVWLGLATRNYERAGHALTRLKAQAEAVKIHAQRSIKGLELLLGVCSGALDTRMVDFDGLTRFDDALGSALEHFFFAVGLFATQMLAERQSEAEARFIDYIRFRRRERYPIRPAIASLGLPDTLDAHLSALLDRADMVTATHTGLA